MLELCRARSIVGEEPPPLAGTNDESFAACPATPCNPTQAAPPSSYAAQPATTSIEYGTAAAALQECLPRLTTMLATQDGKTAIARQQIQMHKAATPTVQGSKLGRQKKQDRPPKAANPDAKGNRAERPR